jgi:mono/diheme cytochrome c family protein
MDFSGAGLDAKTPLGRRGYSGRSLEINGLTLKEAEACSVFGSLKFSLNTVLSLFILTPLLHAVTPSVTYENRPLGSIERPLVFRSYLPDPGLDPAVFRQHYLSSKALKYNPGIGQDVAGEIKPLAGIVAGVGVNFGPALSYVFDTTECRLLYVWQGGFVDMTPYWGDQDKGSRLSFDYVPRLVGTLFWKTEGDDPISLAGKSLTELGPREYLGYHLEKGVPIFKYRAGEASFSLAIRPSTTPLACEITLTTSSPGALAWRGTTASATGTLQVKLTGTELGKYQGYIPMAQITKASAEAGAGLFNQYGCAACHSIDGSKSHGPSLGKLADTKVEIEGSAQPIVADHAYLLESIKAPNAKVVKGYPPNYMPPFTLREVEYEALILYIQSLANPE